MDRLLCFSLALLVGWPSGTAVAPATAPVAYRRSELHELIGWADRIVVGEIESIAERTYLLRVERVMHGEAAARIRVNRFEDWTCAGRWSTYRTGQRALLFLREGSAIGAGNEGDMAVVGDGALIQYPVHGSRFVPRWADEPVLSSWVSLDEVEDAVRFLRGAFRIEWVPEDWTYRTECLVSPERLLDARATSGLVRTLLNNIEQAREAGTPMRRSTDTRGLVVSAAGSRLDRYLDRRQEDGLGWGSDFAARISVLGGGASAPSRLLASATHEAFLLPIDEAAATAPIARLPRPDGRTHLDFYPYGIASLDVGDTDEDGRSDVLIADPASCGTLIQGDENKTKAWLFYPGTSKPPRSMASPKTHPNLVEGCLLAHTMARLGDLDGDGVTEIAMARTRDCPRPWSEEEVLHPCEASIAIGTIEEGGLVLRSTIAAAAFDSSGPERGHSFATSIAGVGDVDGDGTLDLAIGDPHRHGLVPYAGAIWIAFLRPDGSLRASRPIASAELGLRPGGEFGASLCAVGDLDGNGVPDLVVGGSTELWVLLLDAGGGLEHVRHHDIESLLPKCEEVRDLAAALEGPGAVAREIFVSGHFGPQRPFDACVYVLSLDSQGTLSVGRKGSATPNPSRPAPGREGER